MIHNKTGWRTRDLRKVFTAVYRTVRKTEGQLGHTLKITVTHSRGMFSGYAYLNSGIMRLSIPSPKFAPAGYEPGGLDVLQLAWLFDHELAHCYGHQHKVMGRLNHASYASPFNYPYLEGVTVAPVPPVIRDRANIPTARAARLSARLKAWQDKERRAARAVARLKRQLAGYARRGVVAA